ncbi:MAG: hypothetical protein M3Q07_21835 [Pseudobdellovibrionaceae bacterium]|nr:hypothetical protein [Pseudobdellovibrionaceae bacterium]
MKYLNFALIAMMLSACNPVMKTFIASKKDDDGNAKKSTESDADAERVDVPTNIAGSYLMCSLRKDASAADVSSEYGCRLNEAGTMTRLDLSTTQNRIQWQSNLPIGVVIASNPSNSVWHALYTITATDLPALRERVAQLQVQVQWTLPSGSVLTTFKDQKLVEILQPADAAGDTSAPILQGPGLDPSDPGTL